MEERAKSKEKTNGDQVENKEQSLDTSIQITIAEKVNRDEETLLDEKSIDSVTSASETNPATNVLCESKSGKEKLSEIKEALSAEESSAAAVTETTRSTGANNTQEATTQNEPVDKSVKKSEKAVPEVDSTIVEELIEIKEAPSAEESSAAEVTETPESAETNKTPEVTVPAEPVDKSVNKSEKAVPEVGTTIVEEISPKEVPKEAEQTATMDLTTEPTNQAMEIEEPDAPVPVAIVSIQEQVVADQKLETEAVQQISNSSLSMLCQYSGSSDSEAEDTDTSNVLREGKVSSSSSSSDDSDVELVKESSMIVGGYRVQDDPILVSDAETMDTNAASSEDETDEPVTGPIRTAGEILPHELPPIEELTITVPETECKPIGHIDSIVSQIVLVQSVAGVELLNLDTVLFLERGKRALGKIFDVIGQVNQPIYCVLFNSNQEILSKNITTGMEVFCAPKTEYTSFIILSELMRLKGSDASWMHDNEIPSYMAEHSDDEEERAAKRNRKKSAANRQQNDDGGCSEMGEEPQQHHYNPRYPNPSTFRGHNVHHPPQGGRQFNPRYPSGSSWHHNYNPRFNHPQQYRPRYPKRSLQHFQQIPHMHPPPQGGMFLRNPFAGQGPPRPPPPSGSN